MKEEIAIAHTKAWIERMVIGMNLCPFAAVPFRKEQIRYRVVASGLDGAAWMSLLLEEGRILLDPDQEERIDTTLLILPEGWSDFDQYLDLSSVLAQLLIDAGWEGDLQIATFHPDYQFAHSVADDPANYTNRSPYPLIHLLREDRMEQALQGHPAPETIPPSNMARMRQLGVERLEMILKEIKRTTI